FLRRLAGDAVGGELGAGGAEGDEASPASAPIDLDEGVEPDATAEVRRSRLLGRVSELWGKNLSRSSKARAYLARRAIHDGALVSRFGIGYCDGSLPQKVPEAMKAELAEIGILNARGNESFYQCITVPLRGERGEVVSIYGRSIGATRHHYLRGPRRGLLNREAFLLFDTVILAEAPIDALTLIRHGFPNATASYGTQGFTDDHRRALEAGRVELVLLCLDNDEAGRAAQKPIGREIESLGKEVLVVELPGGSSGKDVNDFFVAGGTREGFEALLAEARPFAERRVVSVGEHGATAGGNGTVSEGKGGNGACLPKASPSDRGGRPPSSRLSPLLPSSSSSPSSPPSSWSSVAAPSSSPTPTPAPAAPPVRPVEVVREGEREIVLRVGELDWRVAGRVRGGRDVGSLRVSLRVATGEAVHLDRLDLYVAGARRRFAREAAGELGVQPRALEGALVRVAEVIEWVVDERERRMKEKAKSGEERPPMTDEERRAATALLDDARLLERVVFDLDRLGYVGEALNKRLAY
ncbi:MAG: toprim domain-containing protein, partial [Candidatus Binatia bacterium]